MIDEILVRRVWYEKQKQHVPGFFDQGYICCHSDGSPYHRSHFGEDFHKPVRMKAISEFLGHYSPEFTEEVYVYQEEKIYDCSVLCEIWEISRPPNEKNELLVPLSDSDYYALLA